MAVSSPAAAQTQPDAQPAAEEEALPIVGPTSAVSHWPAADLEFNCMHMDCGGDHPGRPCALTTWKNIKEVPSGMQNLMEALVEGWENFMTDVLDAKVTRWVFPFATTFFIFILLSDYVDLIPGVGTSGSGRPRKTA
jgi:hypothetical protein